MTDNITLEINSTVSMSKEWAESKHKRLYAAFAVLKGAIQDGLVNTEDADECMNIRATYIDLIKLTNKFTDDLYCKRLKEDKKYRIRLKSEKALHDRTYLDGIGLMHIIDKNTNEDWQDALKRYAKRNNQDINHFIQSPVLRGKRPTGIFYYVGLHIGETKKRYEISPYYKKENKDDEFMWTACVLCGRNFWVGMQNNMPITNECMQAHKEVNNKKTPRLTNGRYMNGDGYTVIKIHKSDPYFPMTVKKEKKNYYEKGQISARILEHRYIMAQHLGRCLESWEVVHHINGIKSDNRIENLELLQEPKEHLPSMAMQQRIKKLEKQLSAT